MAAVSSASHLHAGEHGTSYGRGAAQRQVFRDAAAPGANKPMKRFFNLEPVCGRARSIVARHIREHIEAASNGNADSDPREVSLLQRATRNSTVGAKSSLLSGECNASLHRDHDGPAAVRHRYGGVTASDP